MPPLTNQYLNLTKNSSLAVSLSDIPTRADLRRHGLNQTGQAIEIIVITMAVYLALSLGHQPGDELVQRPCAAGGALRPWIVHTGGLRAR